MSSPTEPVPLICLAKKRELGERVHSTLIPKVSYNAIMTTWSKSLLYSLLDNLNPTPVGVVIGGGFDDHVEEVQEALTEWTAIGGGRAVVKLLAVPKDLMPKEGPAAVAEYLRNRMTAEFGVSW